MVIKDAERRLDLALLEAWNIGSGGTPDGTLSRSKLKELFKDNAVLLSGRPRPASHLLSPGSYEVVILRDPGSSLTEALQSEQTFLPVVYEDSELLILNKLSGIPSVPLTPEETQTAVGSALALRPELRGVGDKPMEPGLLHRLDTGTSGLLVFAKSADTYGFLKNAWKTGAVRKTYRARVGGDASSLPLPSTFRLLLGHHPDSSKRMIVLDRAEKKYRGKPLPTLTRITRAHAISHQDSDLEIEIETGVLHQIRCTLKHLGLPILGDTIYGGVPSDRLQLHAWKLTLPKKNGGELALVSALPAGFV